MMDGTLPLMVSAVVMGLLGGVHCLGMCGGISGALNQAVPRHSPISRVQSTLLYSTGRIFSYALAGGIVGALGEAFSRQTGLGFGLRVIAGFMILACGLYALLEWRAFSGIESAGRAVWGALAPVRTRIKSPDRVWKVVLLGMVWGWLPCGLVYSALIAAAATGRADLGAVFMLSFGLGTLPALLSATALWGGISHFFADRFNRRAAGAALLGFGFWTLGSVVTMTASHGPVDGSHCIERPVDPASAHHLKGGQ